MLVVCQLPDWKGARCRVGVKPMPDYRAFTLTREGHVITVTELHCDEDEAKERARKLATNAPVELWLGPRRVARYDPQRVP